MSTEQATLADVAAKTVLVKRAAYHRPLCVGDEPTAMPACDPSENGDRVHVDPETLADADRCNSPACFGGDARC